MRVIEAGVGLLQKLPLSMLLLIDMPISTFHEDQAEMKKVFTLRTLDVGPESDNFILAIKRLKFPVVFAGHYGMQEF